MSVTAYSLIMALLWFSMFIFLGTLLQRKTGAALCCHLAPLLIMLALTVFRLAVPIELPFTQVITSKVILPGIEQFFFEPWVRFGAFTASGFQLLLWAWVLGALRQGVRLCLRIYRDSRAWRGVSGVSCPDAQRCLERLLAQRGRQRVKLCVSPEVPTPMLVGLLQPAILLPQEAAGLSDGELEYILTHELTHLAHRDLWVKLLVRLLCCLLWWNPLVYLFQRNLDEALEYRCDLAVTKGLAKSEREAYLQSIITAMRRIKKKAVSQETALQASLIGVSEGGRLNQRFNLVLAQGSPQKRFPKAAFAAALLVIFFFSYAAVVQPAYEPPASDMQYEIKITAENSYILKTSDGSYYLTYKGERVAELAPVLLADRPYCCLSIQE